MSCYCFLRNVVDILVDGMTPWRKRFGKNFTGPIIPFGAEVQYKPITTKDKDRLHKLGGKLLSGVFVGYSQQVGGGWSGDLLVIDWEELENADNVSEVYIKRFAHPEVFPTKSGDQFRFPLKEGALRQPGSDRQRAPKRRVRGPRRERETSEGNGEGESSPEPQDLPENEDDSEARSDSEPLPSEGDPNSVSKDTWTITNSALIRHHKTLSLIHI